MTLQVLNAFGTTTNIQALSINAGTVLTQSVPTNAAGLPMIGQTTMANSLAVVLPSDQSAIPVSGTVTAVVSGTVSGSFSASFSAATSFAVVASSSAVAPVAVKAGSGTLYGMNLYCNNTTNPVFLRLYNLGTASVNATSVPNVIIGIPPGDSRDPVLPAGGVAFGTAISYQITQLGIPNDTTAVSANDLLGWITYF